MMRRRMIQTAHISSANTIAPAIDPMMIPISDEDKPPEPCETSEETGGTLDGFPGPSVTTAVVVESPFVIVCVIIWRGIMACCVSVALGTVFVNNEAILSKMGVLDARMASRFGFAVREPLGTRFARAGRVALSHLCSHLSSYIGLPEQISRVCI